MIVKQAVELQLELYRALLPSTKFIRCVTLDALLELCSHEKIDLFKEMLG